MMCLYNALKWPAGLVSDPVITAYGIWAIHAPILPIDEFLTTSPADVVMTLIKQAFLRDKAELRGRAEAGCTPHRVSSLSKLT